MKDQFVDQQIDKDKMPLDSESLYVRKCIRTVSGKYINVFDPDPDDITIEDIAHALGNQCRFGGHLPEFYSVAQHSILCYNLATKPHELAALMHDASEAYLLDMPKPIKLEMPQYNDIEDNLMKVIAKKFGFEYPKSKEVASIDHYMLEWEWNSIMLNNNAYPEIKLMTNKEATDMFLETYKELVK